jgi:hypothetical protein
MKQKIIAIQGFIGSGKDTLAEIIYNKEKELGKNVIKLSFAASLKDSVSIIFGWDRKLLEGDTKESRDWREQIDEWWSKRLDIPYLTPRWVLQNIGTNVMRNHFHSDIWLSSLERKIFNLKDVDTIIISDCRFENEMECLRRLSAIFIKIYRGEQPLWVSDYLNYNIIPSNIHSSEYLWLNNNFDYMIENNGSIDELKQQINFLQSFILF